MSKLNSEKTQMLGMTPAKAVKLDKVELKSSPILKKRCCQKTAFTDTCINQESLREVEQRRATDMIWSWNTFRIDRIVENPGQRVLYYLAEGPKSAFVREELMQIPEDTEVPPDYVKEW